MALNVSEYSSNTTEQNNTMEIEDFLEYQISVKIHLYYLPIILFVGIPGNVISFVVLVFSSFRKSTTSMYLAVISVLDTVILCISMVWYVNREIPNMNIISDVLCRIVNVIFYFCIHYNVMLVIAVTVERFVVVVLPLKAQSLISMKRTVVAIVSCGVFSLGLNLHHLFIRKAVFSRKTGSVYCGSTGGKTTRFFLYTVYPWIDSFIYCFLPMTSIFVLNIVMLRHMIRNLRRRRRLQPMRRIETQSSRRQMTAMLLLVSFSFLFFTGPMGIFLVVKRYTLVPKTLKEKAESRLVHSVIDNMVYTNHAINFLFYCFTGQKFRNELKRMWCCFISKRPGRYVQTIKTVSN